MSADSHFFNLVEPGELNQPKKFHKYHGSNVILERNDTVACRSSSYANALVFSESPLKPFDLFLLEIEEIERGWSGDMRIGLTTMNPSEAHSAGQALPQYALPDLSALKPSWIYCISKSTFFNKRRRPPGSPSWRNSNVAYHMSFQPDDCAGEKCATDVGSQIGVVYVPMSPTSAKVHVLVNGVDQGVFVNDIPYTHSPLYAVVDVYGCTKKVRVIQVKYNANSLQEICRQAILQSIQNNAVSKLPLPNPLKDYLLKSVLR